MIYSNEFDLPLPGSDKLKIIDIFRHIANEQIPLNVKGKLVPGPIRGFIKCMEEGADYFLSKTEDLEETRISKILSEIQNHPE